MSEHAAPYVPDPRRWRVLAVSLLTRRIGPVAAAALGASGTLLIGWGSCHPEFVS